MLAFQALYGQEFQECTSVEDLKKAFLAVPRQDEQLVQEEPSGFAWELVCGVWQHRDELDAVIEKFAHNWRLDRVGRVELNLLRLGVYEMLYRADVPARVSMNEALELDKQYGDARSHTFVNGILDAVSKAVDKGELRVRS
jgi:N utilization substance protein B